MSRSLLIGLLCSLAGVLFSSPANARVFKFSEEGVGTYFKVGGATSIVGQDAFANSSGSTVVFDKNKVTHSLSGELGAVITTTWVNLRLGLGAMQPTKVVTIGSDSSGTELFTLTSSMQAPYASVGLEYNLYQTESTRMFFTMAGAMTQFTLTNNYAFTAAGGTALGVTDYLEESTVQVMAPEIAFNFEWLMVDTTTMNWEFGYRQFQVTGLKYKSDATGINGAITSGSDVTNNNSSLRDLDMSGIFINLGFRFYIDI